MTQPAKPDRTLPRIVPAFACALLLAACAGPGIRGEPPFVQVNGLRLAERDLTLDLGLRNVNAEPLQIEHIEFSVTLEETSLARYNAASRASVIANGRENLRFELAASEEGAALLGELESGSRSDLRYRLEGVVTASESKPMRVQREGRLYPVPGRPGQFR